jgi:hypothetical protein
MKPEDMHATVPRCQGAIDDRMFFRFAHPVCTVLYCMQPSSWQPCYWVMRLDSTTGSTAGRQDHGKVPAITAATADSSAHVVSVKRVVELLGPRAEPGASTKLVVLDVSGIPCGCYLPGVENESLAAIFVLYYMPALPRSHCYVMVMTASCPL